MRIPPSTGPKMTDAWFVICVSEFACVNRLFYQFGKIDPSADQKKASASPKNKANKANVYSVTSPTMNHVRMVATRIARMILE